MKYIWEEKDIVCGRFVCKPATESRIKNPGWHAKWTMKIRYVGASSAFQARTKDEDASGVVIIAMTDGMVSQAMSKAQMVDYFNSQSLIPAPHEWMLELAEYLRDTYETE